MTAPTPSPLPFSPSQLAAAPHRLMFFIGAANVLLAMAWWTFWLLALRWQPEWLPTTPVPAAWGHGMLMTFQVFTPFIFGFLLTVFPRWLGQPAVRRRHYVPVALGLLGGQVLTLASFSGLPACLAPGLGLTAIGWCLGLGWLGAVMRAAKAVDWHARSAFMALSVGVLALMVFIATVHRPTWAGVAPMALQVGLLGFLLPIYLTVAHRMLPFFAGNVVADYHLWRPLWVLAAFWGLICAHLLLDLGGLSAWRWLADASMAVLAAYWLWRIAPRPDRHAAAPKPIPPLLSVLFIALGWLPLAWALYALQSLALRTHPEAGLLLGKAPLHALAVGLFGALLVAMVTRVTQGHSGRPLHMTGVAWFAFIVVQIAAVTRIGAELMNDPWTWHGVAAVVWLLAFLPWCLRHAWIYLTPRADGAPG